jgi:hypothetical protein
MQVRVKVLCEAHLVVDISEKNLQSIAPDMMKEQVAAYTETALNTLLPVTVAEIGEVSCRFHFKEIVR